MANSDLNPNTGTGSVSQFGAWTTAVFAQLASMLCDLSATGLTGSADAIPPHTSCCYIVNTAGVDAMTLAAPTVGAQKDGGDSGRTIRIISGTANAHTLTATGLLQTGSANVNVATFAAFAGAGLLLRAHAGKWQVLSQIGITFS